MLGGLPLVGAMINYSGVYARDAVSILVSFMGCRYKTEIDDAIYSVVDFPQSFLLLYVLQHESTTNPMAA